VATPAAFDGLGGPSYGSTPEVLHACAVSPTSGTVASPLLRSRCGFSCLLSRLRLMTRSENETTITVNATIRSQRRRFACQDTAWQSIDLGPPDAMPCTTPLGLTGGIGTREPRVRFIDNAQKLAGKTSFSLCCNLCEVALTEYQGSCHDTLAFTCDSIVERSRDFPAQIGG